MKIFISWSGTRSHQVAQLLDSWLSCVLQAVTTWVSSKDIDKGSLWFSEISNQLAHTQNGIVCLTKANLNKPWILFESGALAKGLSSNRVFTFLIDLEPRDIKDPLAQFNHTFPEKGSVYMLVKNINQGLGENNLKEEVLLNVFETYWPKFEKSFIEIIKRTESQEIKKEISESQILDEILYSVRGIDKKLRFIETDKILRTSPSGFERIQIRQGIQKYVRGKFSDDFILDKFLSRASKHFILSEIALYRKEYELENEKNSG